MFYIYINHICIIKLHYKNKIIEIINLKIHLLKHIFYHIAKFKQLSKTTKQRNVKIIRK